MKRAALIAACAVVTAIGTHGQARQPRPSLPRLSATTTIPLALDVADLIAYLREH